MASIGSIKNAYSNCIANTCTWLNKKNYAIKYATPIVRNEETHYRVTFAEPLYFQNWPYRCDSKSTKRIDILANIDETINSSDGKCVRSTLRLYYFLLDGEKRIACDAIHYDFNVSIQDRHPISHAQCESSLPELFPDGFPSDDVDEQPIAGRHQAIRIPCAFVNFAGLFAKLTADHLQADDCTEFWNECKAFFEAIPDHSKTEISEALFKAKTLKSYHWYKW